MRGARTLMTAAAVAVTAATVGVTTTAAHGNDGCVSSIERVQSFGATGIAPWFSSKWWVKKVRVIPDAADSPLCETDTTLVSAVATFEATQAKFVTLYRAFPRTPTAAQWKLRYVPLIRQAIKTDRAIQNVVTAYTVAWNAYWDTLHHCGMPPNPPGRCDNESLRDNVDLGSVDQRHVQTDIVTLTGLLMARVPVSH